MKETDIKSHWKFLWSWGPKKGSGPDTPPLKEKTLAYLGVQCSCCTTGNQSVATKSGVEWLNDLKTQFPTVQVFLETDISLMKHEGFRIVPYTYPKLIQTNKHLIQTSNSFLRFNMTIKNERRCFEVCGHGSNPNFPKAKVPEHCYCYSQSESCHSQGGARQHGLQISVRFF